MALSFGAYSPAPLCDVQRDRRRCAAQLVCEIAEAAPESTGYRMCTWDELEREVVGIQLVVFHGAISCW
ncbi:MAG: hypothetical protein A2138_11625 [Deltaproteobacteria bacterium RBG_16_71_12]|nr:MAG: hypothetical protein A2138_11625 [Deltaproteobacteria bacterium RBG_16_71_12]